MKTGASTVEVGTRILWDGDAWLVTALSGTSLRLRSSDNVCAALISEVLEDPSFAIVDAGEAPPARHSVLDDVPTHAVTKAQALARELQTMLTGYPDGQPTPDHPEPDPAYGDCKSLHDRQMVLAGRLGVSKRSVQQMRAKFDERGVSGLVDERHLRLARGTVDPILHEAIVSVLDANIRNSKVTNDWLRYQVGEYLKANYPNAAPVPEKRKFNRALEQVRIRRNRSMSSKSERSIANAPADVYGTMAVHRPFQYVLIDSTPLDTFVIDPTTGKWVNAVLTLALDLFSRSIVGWVFTHGDPIAADISLLLHRIVTPKTLLPGWPATARWRYPGVPEYLWVEGPHPARGVAAVPAGSPEEFVVDHGKVFISSTVTEAARILGANVQLSRVLTPTDKAHVEAVFRRIRQQFLMGLPGYKGPDVHSRGTVDRVEDAATLTLWEMDDYFGEWVCTDYQVRVHEGLTLQSMPHLRLSPNEMYDYGILAAGFIRFPNRGDLHIELLPTEWRTIKRDGVTIQGIRYDGDILNSRDYRFIRSPWLAPAGKSGKKLETKGLWKFKRDPRDLSQIWFWACEPDDPRVGSWEKLTYRGWDDAPMFSQKELDYAKLVVLGRGGNVKEPDQVWTTMSRILARITTGGALTPTERSLAARRANEESRLEDLRAELESALPPARRLAAVPTERDPSQGTDGDVVVEDTVDSDPSSGSKAGAADRQAPASVVPNPGRAEPARRAADDDGYDGYDEISTLRTREEVEIDFFADFSDASDGGADFGGLEDLEAEK